MGISDPSRSGQEKKNTNMCVWNRIPIVQTAASRFIASNHYVFFTK